MSKLLNPFVDFAFKYIFGREDSKPYLIDFLNSLLESEPGYSRIVDLTYRDKESGRRSEEERNVIYDIHCRTADGRYFTVEMQNASQTNFLDRVIYYAARTVADQGKPGRDWRYQYDPVYCIALMNFELPEFAGRFRIDAGLCDLETRERVSDKIRCIMLQLPNFDKKDKEAECHTRLEQWTYNLINMPTMERLAFTNNNKLFKQLEERVSYATLKGSDKSTYDADLKAYRDMMGQLEFALDQGWKRGLEKGMAQGMAQGMEKGEKIMKERMVKSMAEKGLDVQIIAAIAEISVDAVKAMLKS